MSVCEILAWCCVVHARECVRANVRAYMRGSVHVRVGRITRMMICSPDLTPDDVTLWDPPTPHLHLAPAHCCLTWVGAGGCPLLPLPFLANPACKGRVSTFTTEQHACIFVLAGCNRGSSGLWFDVEGVE
jgi:hypothetical protein